MKFTSNNNKKDIWKLLEESNIFKGMKNNKVPIIKHIMENVINEINNNNSDLSLIEQNGMAVKEIIRKIIEGNHQTISVADLPKQDPENLNLVVADLPKQDPENLNLVVADLPKQDPENLNLALEIKILKENQDKIIDLCLCILTKLN